jgi:hypothetical protein
LFCSTTFLTSGLGFSDDTIDNNNNTKKTEGVIPVTKTNQPPKASFDFTLSDDSESEVTETESDWEKVQKNRRLSKNKKQGNFHSTVQ